MPNRAAVVIGINYDTLPPGVHPDATKSAGINRLRYAEADARDVAALLTEAGYDVKLLTGAAATQRAIISTIVQQRRAAGPDGFLLIHFSGHGDVDPDDPQTAYLLPADTDPDALAASGIALDELVQRHLRGVKSTLALLDCCHSGYALGWKSGTDTGERGRAFLAQAHATFQEVRGRVVLAACAGEERTRELTELAHGVFTYYLLDHWRNYADEVTIGSMFDSIDKALESRGLSRPVRGGMQESRIVLRPPVSVSPPIYPAPILLPSDAERREKVFISIKALNDISWITLLNRVGCEASDLAGTTRPAKTRSLIHTMIVEGLFGVLEQAVREQAPRQAEIADLLTQLIEAASKYNWDQVIDLGERILKLDAQHQMARAKTAAAYNRRSTRYQKQGNYDRAIADTTRAIGLDPQHIDYYVERAEMYCRKGDYDRAIADYTRAIEIAPNEAQYWQQRGASYYAKGDYDRAIADQSRAITLAPQRSVYYLERGESYRRKRDYDRAIVDLNYAVQLTPYQAEYYNYRGINYYGKGDYDRAIADFNYAIHLTPSTHRYYYNRGMSYKAKKSYDAARRDLQQAVRLGFDLAQQELANL